MSVELIPTTFKEKLPRTLAYPVGAQILTDALAETPQLEELTLWFSRGDHYTTENTGRHLCIEVRYNHWHLGI